MEDLINDSIIESISEEYQIYKVTLNDNVEIVIKYAILETLDDWKIHSTGTFEPNNGWSYKRLKALSLIPKSVSENRDTSNIFIYGNKSCVAECKDLTFNFFLDGAIPACHSKSTLRISTMLFLLEPGINTGRWAIH